MKRDFSLTKNKLGQPRVSHNISLKNCVTAILKVLLHGIVASKKKEEDQNQFELVWLNSSQLVKPFFNILLPFSVLICVICVLKKLIGRQ